MKIVSNASPLIAFARIGRLACLRKLFHTIYIPEQVYAEVVLAGAGMPGATAVSEAEWIQVCPIQDNASMAKMLLKFGLGAGETSAVLLAREIGAELVLMDEWRGRRMATQEGLNVAGCVGLLEELHRRSELTDLRGA